MQSQTSLPVWAEKKNNRMAFAAGWLGIATLLLFLIGVVFIFTSGELPRIVVVVASLTSLAGLCLGIVGLQEIKKHPEQKGRSMAMTGIIVGLVLLCVAPVLVIAILALFI